MIDHKRINSAEQVPPKSSDIRMTVQNLLLQANQASKQIRNVSDSESALATCLKMQQRGQIPIKALKDAHYFKKKDWATKNKMRLQMMSSCMRESRLPLKREMLKSTQAFVRPMTSGIKHFIKSVGTDMFQPLKSTSMEPSVRDSIEHLRSIEAPSSCYEEESLKNQGTSEESRLKLFSEIDIKL